ncbi:MAG: cation-binding protein [Nitrososphaeria archaeon]|nr:cation-binding protein [Nitrososphaeria archaeon]NDB50816.1 cation-binding protein [Nitrosopumilaceae archaeon]NDB89564.1 cation-binding protein [Nitrososphaerota archaeon]NDF25514.1 cation-binding protein [Nitrososphaerota archaeon]NDF34420.1 cation-binding protein [Nitrosopumilaceae archaeon]
MATESLRKDHDLIEKVVKAMEVTLQMLKSGKKIPESILMPTIDFTKNFTDVCHHGKEEESFFPALGQAGFPTNMGPIAVMLMEHEITRKIAIQMETSAKEYLKSGSADALISDIAQYVQHMSEHLWKENNKLFMMAEMRLSGVSDRMNADLDSVEKKKLEQLGKSRQDYENIVQNIHSEISKIN